MTIVMGHTPGSLIVSLQEGMPFQWTQQLLDEGAPTDWPIGVAVFLRFSSAEGFAATWLATVDGSFLRWSATVEQVDAVPGGAKVDYVLDYPDAQPFVYITGKVSFRRAAMPSRVMRLPQPGHGTLVPVPGPPGPGGSPGVIDGGTPDGPVGDVIDGGAG